MHLHRFSDTAGAVQINNERTRSFFYLLPYPRMVRFPAGTYVIECRPQEIAPVSIVKDPTGVYTSKGITLAMPEAARKESLSQFNRLLHTRDHVKALRLVGRYFVGD